MFCHKCGKEIPDGAKFCNYCGTAMPEAGPRHARPEPEDIYSYSEENRPSEFDVDPDKLEIRESTRVFDPIRDNAQKDYDLSLFEDGGEPRPAVPEADLPDDREMINDSYDNYTDDEDDRTFMDKLDDTFRRDEDRYPRRQSGRTWLWVVLGVVAVALVIVLAVLVISASSAGRSKDVKPTAAPTVAATAAVTEAEKATEAPKPTEAPAPTDPPATQAPAPTSAPITEAPAPTEAPQPDPEPEPEPTPESEPDTPQEQDVQE